MLTRMLMIMVTTNSMTYDDDGVVGDNSFLVPVGLGQDKGTQQETDREGLPCNNVRLDVHGQPFLVHVHGVVHQQLP